MKLLNSRQTAILEIINESAISDQRTLIERLDARGIPATQATISRDIRKLGLKKTRLRNSDGTFSVRYAVEPQPIKNVDYSKFEGLYRDNLIFADCAQNIIVIKTGIGMAQAVCAAFDSIGFERVVGSIAGDDTIFIVCKTSEDAQNVMYILNKTAKKE